MFAKQCFSLILAMTFICRVVPAIADDIALSLVHGQNRIDIPVSAIQRIESYATLRFVVAETKEVQEFPAPRVELCYAPDIQRRICRLTRRIIEQPMDLVVDCQTLSRPVVREPLCGPCLQIRANDILEANALAKRLKTGSNHRCAPVS